MNGPALARLADLRRDPRPGEDLKEVYGEVLAALARTATIAMQLKEAPHGSV